MRRIFKLLGLTASLCILALGQARAQGPLPAEVSAIKQGDGWLLADAKGMTLYLYESDEKGSGKSACNGACAKAWPPLVATSDNADNIGEWSVIVREDGQKQWAFKGKPVYRYAKDTYVGGTFGDGESWKVAFQPIPMPPGIAIGKTLIGRVLASPTGLTLYTHGDTSKAGRASDCVAACLETWLPIAAPWMATTVGDFSVVQREDGIYQWAYKSAPLYLFANDTKPGDTNGDGRDKAWHAVVLEPPPPLPSWVTVVASDGGDLLADTKGMTIYAYDSARNALVRARGEDCFDACIKESWTPVPAEAQVAPIGNWSVVKNDDGGLQWAYQGKPLYTSKVETQRGDLTGIMLRRSRAWRPIMLSMPSIQGASPNG